MAAVLAEDDFFDLIINGEEDTFRLTIRAHAAIEDLLDDAIGLAFIRGQPRFLSSLSVRRKLELGVGLGVLHEDFSDGFIRLTKLRNQLAHGEVDKVSIAQARGLFGAVRQLIQPLDQTVADDAASLLQWTLATFWFDIQSSRAIFLENQQRIEEALAIHSRPLSVEEIQAALAAQEEDE